MKALMCAILIVSIHARAEINDCLKDARSTGNHLHAVNPAKRCALTIKNLKDKIESKVPGLHAYGIDHMFYVEAEDGTQELMAGDQTELKKISQIHLYPEENRILVLQPGSVATFRLNFVGNVTPLFHNKHPHLNGVSQAKLSGDEVYVSHPEFSSIMVFNAKGDSRKIGKEKPEVKRSLMGPRTQFHRPLDLEILPKQKLLIVLDEGRLLVFPASAGGNTPPIKILNLGLEDASGLKLEGETIIVQSQEKVLKVSLDQLK